MNDFAREDRLEKEPTVATTAVAKPVRLELAMPPLAPAAEATKTATGKEVPVEAGVFGFACVLGVVSSLIGPGVGLAVFPTLVLASAAISLTGWKVDLDMGD